MLGVGGTGVVVAARHTQLDTRMALKFLLPAMLDKPEAVKRFARASRAASKITNEHVARVFDVGTLENGAPFMVTEFLEGEDLSAWVEQRGALPVDLAKSECNATSCPSATMVKAQSDHENASSAATIGTIGFVAAGVLAATGIVMYLTAPSKVRDEHAGSTLVPTMGLGGAGATLQGSFQ